jgi:hypothetical protein
VRRGDGGQPVGAATAQEGTEMRSIGKAIGGMSVSAVTSGVRCSGRAETVRRRWRKAGDATKIQVPDVGAEETGYAIPDPKNYDAWTDGRRDTNGVKPNGCVRWCPEGGASSEPSRAARRPCGTVQTPTITVDCHFS